MGKAGVSWLLGVSGAVFQNLQNVSWKTTALMPVMIQTCPGTLKGPLLIFTYLWRREIIWSQVLVF